MNTRPVFFALFIVAAGFTAIAQPDRRDKASYVPHHNEFYGRIEDSLAGFGNNWVSGSRGMVFRMDYSGLVIPQSTDEFTKVWCQSPVSQGRTGTCWCFSTTSFFESEIFRITGQQIRLSELYVVYWEYVEKAREFVRTRGTSFFEEGSETNAVARMMKKYGAVPAEAYDGMQDGQPFHDHQAMFSEMEKYLNSVKQSNAWNEEQVLSTIRSILGHYLGAPPASFDWNGKTYTPASFLAGVARIKPDDYVEFMSLMQSPYYEKAEYLAPDNWWKSRDYCNVPLTDFMEGLKGALKAGYSVSIGGDVSESGIDPERNVAMVPAYDIPSSYIDEYARQLRFLNGSTTDDHAVHAAGYLQKDGQWWFLIKDSGSSSRNGKNPGWYFFHEDFVKLKMMTYTVHKDAVKDVLKKMKPANL